MADVLVETLVAFGITHVFGMVGHSNLGFADAMRRAEERGQQPVEFFGGVVMGLRDATEVCAAFGDA